MFETGRVYKRAQLHDEWNGTTQVQAQGGILTPKQCPIIIVITGAYGAQFGYDDRWDEDGVLHYYGAGQEGDMVFLRGNRALRDHVADGKAVHLFEKVDGGLRYLREVVVEGWYEVENVPDAKGNNRKGIVFELVPLDQVSELDDASSGEPAEAGWDVDLDALRARVISSATANGSSSTTGKRTIYARSRDVRIYVLRRADGNCEGCGTPAPFTNRDGKPYLEPHHTTRLSDGGPDHPRHVIALCPTCHRRVHHGDDGDDYNRSLIKALQALEPPD